MINLFVNQLLIIIVSLVACVVIVTRWKKLGPASLWAFSGFGLTLLLGIAQVVFMVLNTGMLGDLIPTMRPWMSKIMGIAPLFLHPLAYVLLLVAIFAARTTSTSADLPAAGPQ